MKSFHPCQEIIAAIVKIADERQLTEIDGIKCKHTSILLDYSIVWDSSLFEHVKSGRLALIFNTLMGWAKSPNCVKFSDKPLSSIFNPMKN